MNSLAIFSACAPALLTAGQSPNIAATAGPNPLGSLLTLLGAIALLVLALGFAYIGTRYIGRRYGAPLQNKGGIEVLERVMLSPDRSLMVVRVKSRVLLLGVTAHHISHLAELDAALYSGSYGSESIGEGFASFLRGSLNTGHKGDKSADRKD